MNHIFCYASLSLMLFCNMYFVVAQQIQVLYGEKAVHLSSNENGGRTLIMFTELKLPFEDAVKFCNDIEMHLAAIKDRNGDIKRKVENALFATLGKQAKTKILSVVMLKRVASLRSSFTRLYARATQLQPFRRNVAAVASRWQHCIRFDRTKNWTSDLPLQRRISYRSIK